jgi:hypothetical protein
MQIFIAPDTLASNILQILGKEGLKRNVQVGFSGKTTRPSIPKMSGIPRGHSELIPTANKAGFDPVSTGFYSS